MREIFDPLKAGLPVSEEAERFFLGSVLINQDQLRETRELLAANDFGLDRHRRIWTQICALYDGGAHVDRSTVGIALHAAGGTALEAVGGLSYLISLDEGLPRIHSLDSYVAEIRKKSLKRRAILKCNEIMIRLSQTGEDEGEVFADAEASMGQLGGELAQESGFSTPSEIITDAGGVDKYLSQRRTDGVLTPWSQLNRMTGGLRTGNLVVLAAHTGRGKTAMALNVAHCAASHGHGVAIFSMEMDKSENNDRLISIAGKIDGRSLRRPERDEADEYNRRMQLRKAIHSLADVPIYISDKNRSTVPAMAAELRRLTARKKIGLVVVDYLQLAQGVGRFDKRADEVASISRGLKRIAMDFGVPVLALSQFNRDSAKLDREPELYDLKESSGLEQDANVVLMIHFTRMYDVSAHIETGEVKLLVRKQRSGPVGWIPLMFHAPSGVFYETESNQEAA